MANTKKVETTALDAWENALAELEELKDECEDLVDGADGTGRAQTGFIQAMQENLDMWPDAPTIDSWPACSLADLNVKFEVELPKKAFGKIHISRADRMSNITAALYAISNAIQDAKIDENNEDMVADYNTAANEISDFAGELEGTSWPSMRG